MIAEYVGQFIILGMSIVWAWKIGYARGWDASQRAQQMRREAIFHDADGRN